MEPLVPEFISVLRDIRDNKYPQISSWYSSIENMHQEIEAMNENVIAIQNDVNTKNTSIKSITVKNPVINVPNQPNGNAGNAQVVYNSITNQFEFSIPIGQQGQSMRIDDTVVLIVDLYLLTSNTGDIVYVEENESIYTKLNTGQNLGASDWSQPMLFSPATEFIQLTDTPITYLDQAGKIPVVSSSENGLVFITGAEFGVIGYNYVKNPLFENFTQPIPIITNVAFGADKRGYGTFDTFIGTPILASDHVRVSNGVTIANVNVYTSGKSAIGVRVNLETIVTNSTIVNTGNMRVFINGSSQFAVTDGTTTNSLAVGMVPNTTDIYEIFATDQDLIVLNLTTGLMASSSLSLTVPTQTSGSVVLGGNALVAKFYAISIGDKSDYNQADGVFEEFAEGWYKTTTGGEMTVLPDIEGYVKGMRFVAGALPTESKVRMNVGDGGQFAGKKVTFSFTAYSSGVGANSVDAVFVTDRGSQVATSRLITQTLGTLVLNSGVEQNYTMTVDVDAITLDTFLDADAKDYIEFTLPSSANYWIVVAKPKFEISAIQTEFTPQGGGLPAVETTEYVVQDSITGGAYIPHGTTVQRPTPTINDIVLRWNEDTGKMEVWNSTDWVDVAQQSTNSGGVRQTVQNGLLSDSGSVVFATAGAGLALNVNGTSEDIKIHFASGGSDSLITLDQDVILSGLEPNAVNYCYFDTVNGTDVTLGSTVFKPKYIEEIPNDTYTTFDTTTKGSGTTLSNGNLTTTKNTTAWANSTVYSGEKVSETKLYAEVTVGATGSNFTHIGLSNNNTYQGDAVYNQAGGYSYLNNGNKCNNGSTTTAYGATYTTGDVIGILYDATTGQITFYKNNVSQGVAFTITPYTEMYLAISQYGVSNSATVNFGSTAFVYAKPSGAVAWNEKILNGKMTFSTTAMKAFVGNGTTLENKKRVFFAEATTDGVGVTNVLCYALNGRYKSIESQYAVSNVETYQHNIGMKNVTITPKLKCKNANLGYVIGEEINFQENVSGGCSVSSVTNNIAKLTTHSAVASVINRTDFALSAITASYWNKFVEIKRSF